MTTKRAVKLIKNGERKEPEIEAEVDPATEPKIWSTEVRSWIVESQQNRHVESLQAFESLFKDELAETASSD
jgi:hypothetical protein